MVKFCAEHGIPHEVTGKLIVATERAELPRLHALVQRGRENGLPVRELGPAQIAEYEPEVRGLAAIHVGTTGVCDFAAVARPARGRLAEAPARRSVYGAEVTADRPAGAAAAVAVRTGRTARSLRARALVNCAGLHCDRIARLAGDEPGHADRARSAASTTSWRRTAQPGARAWSTRCPTRPSRSSACI